MALYQRNNTWYYLFYVNGKRFRGSTKTDNPKEARRIMAKALAAAEAGTSLHPQRAPVIQDFAPKFLDFVDNSRLESQSKRDYRNGWRLIAQSKLLGMRLDQITADDAETTRFHESPYTTNCALRTLRRMLHKAHDWKLLKEVPKIKLVEALPRDAVIALEVEAQLLQECPQPLQASSSSCWIPACATAKWSACVGRMFTWRNRITSIPTARRCAPAVRCPSASG